MYIGRKYIQYRIIGGPQTKYRAIICLKSSTEKYSMRGCGIIWLKKLLQSQVEMKSREDILTLTKNKTGIEQYADLCIYSRVVYCYNIYF